jgi:hypothetical protein
MLVMTEDPVAFLGYKTENWRKCTQSHVFWPLDEKSGYVRGQRRRGHMKKDTIV